jgi:hypothetical protein
MDPRTLARAQALGRIAFGAGLVLAPAAVAGAWVGEPADRPGGRVLAIAMGARDLAIGVGTFRAVGRGGASSWLRAGMLADAADLVATLRSRDDIPAPAVPATVVIAAASVVLGAWLQYALN